MEACFLRNVAAFITGWAYLHNETAVEVYAAANSYGVQECDTTEAAYRYEAGNIKKPQNH